MGVLRIRASLSEVRRSGIYPASSLGGERHEPTPASTSMVSDP
jgi:hypothetical protein